MIGLSYKPGRARAPFQLADLLPCGCQLNLEGADLGGLSPRSIAGVFLEFLELLHKVGLLSGVVHEALFVEVSKASNLHGSFRMALPQLVKFVVHLL